MIRRLLLTAAFFCTTAELIYAQLASYGVILDANTVGTQLSIFSWKPRVFATPFPEVSFPTSETVSVRITPFIGDVCQSSSDLSDYLSALINLAKESLVGVDLVTVPIYFKGTGQLREMHLNESQYVLSMVRMVLSDATFNPFYFESNMARIISGEEQAAYTWAAVNLLRNALISVSDMYNSTQVVVTSGEPLVGIVDLTPTSTQIAFWVPAQV
jgi:hypothetical protein